MSDQTRDNDLGAIWRNQPEEAIPVDLQRMMQRRTEELSLRTQWETWMSLAASVLLIVIVVWRLKIASDRLLEFGLAAALVWIATSLYWFRRRLWIGTPPRDAPAATGLDYYRSVLERRRDHLRNEWLWHGPLAVASVVLLAVVTGRANIAFQSIFNVLPLLLLLVGWTAFGIWRRRMQAKQLQREIEELASLGR